MGSSHLPVLLLVIVLSFTAAVLCYRAAIVKFNSRLRTAVQEHLLELFPGTHVYVASVTASRADTILVHDLRMAIDYADQPRQILKANRVVLHGDLDVSHWIGGKIRVRAVHLEGLQVEAWPTPDEGWSIEALRPHPRPNTTPPKIVFHDTIVRLRRAPGDDEHLIAFHDINGTIRPADASSLTAVSNQTTIPATVVDADAQLPLATDQLRQTAAISQRGKRPVMQATLTGRCGGLIQEVALEGKLDPNNNSWHLSGRLDQLRFSSNLLQRLPPELSEIPAILDGLQCKASLEFELRQSSDMPAPQFELWGDLSQGRLQDARLPYPLEGLSSGFFCNNELLQLREMQAKSGDALLELNMDIFGLRPKSPMVIHIDARNLDLDQRLYQSLPAKWQTYWDRLRLAGRIDGQAQLAFDGQRWTPSATIDCRKVSVEPWLFPYPVHDIVGSVKYENSTVRSRGLTGTAGGQVIRGRFNLSKHDEQWLGMLDFSTDGPVSIDQQLIAALTSREDDQPSGTENFVRSLHPAGAVRLKQATFRRSATDLDTWHRKIDALVYDGSIKYDLFQYPIYDIRGRIVGEDENWWLDQFEGRNDSGRILCSGHWMSRKTGSIPLDLHFQAYAVPIEEELQQALPPDARYVWNQLRPSGAIDSVDIHLQRPQGSDQVETRVTLLEESSSNLTTGRSLRIHPKSFPYWLSDVDCNIEYTAGHVTIHQASAVNGNSRISMTGDCRPDSQGQWRADVRWLPSTRLIVDRQLLQALPKSVRDSLVSLDFRGPISILGNSSITFTGETAEPPATRWDCQIDIEDGQLADGRVIDAMRGTLWLKGHSDGNRLDATGSVAMDALTVQGVPVTRLRGPFALLRGHLFFGSAINQVLPQANGQPATDLTASALAGELRIAGNGRMETGKFTIDARLENAELSNLLQDLGVAHASTKARCHADLHFKGVPWNPQTYEGEGSVRLREAQLYQLPFMIRLLRTASVNAQDDSAFQTADIQFQIDGDRIPLQIACDGELLSLRGEGWTNLRREVDLELYSYVSRRVPISSLVSPLLNQSKYATFMMIEVTGVLDNPQMQRRAFPQLEATFQQIFPELAEENQRGSFLR